MALLFIEYAADHRITTRTRSKVPATRAGSDGCSIRAAGSIAGDDAPRDGATLGRARVTGEVTVELRRATLLHPEIPRRRT